MFRFHARCLLKQLWVVSSECATCYKRTCSGRIESLSTNNVIEWCQSFPFQSLVGGWEMLQQKLNGQTIVETEIGKVKLSWRLISSGTALIRDTLWLNAGACMAEKQSKTYVSVSNWKKHHSHTANIFIAYVFLPHGTECPRSVALYGKSPSTPV